MFTPVLAKHTKSFNLIDTLAVGVDRIQRSFPEVGQWLRSVVGGHIRYYGVPTNRAALYTFRFQVGWLWHRTLLRRSQKARVLWDRMRRLIDRWLPPARTCHPYPLRRLGVIT